MCSKIVFTTQLKLIILVLFGVFSHPTNGFWVDKPKWLKWPPNPPWVGGWYGGGRQNLNVGFYAFSCPQAEFIIQDVFRTAVRKDPGLPAALIRLYFHDCFVNGCDASILLDSTPSGGPTEKTSKGNIGVRGFEVIDEMKKQLEQHCPETVSCADIISFATRDSVTHSGIPYYHVPAGRRDGLTSNPTQVLENLPKPFFNVEQMTQIFTKKGMTQQDLVVLLGAHSIGVAHCYLFLNQFNHYNATYDINPNMDKIFAMNLKKICPIHNITNYNDVMPLNIYRNYKEKLSNIYYSNVINGRTVIPADHSLVDDPNTNYLVHVYANGLFKWVIDFRQAMLKLGQVDVLTGTQGQIRRSCRFVN